MSTLYKTQAASKVVSKKAGGFVLCNFSHAEDLLFGIEALRSLQIPIKEVYSPVRIEDLNAKLEAKRLKVGHAALTYGCLGGMAFTSIIGYCFDHHNNISPLLLLLVSVTFLFAWWLTAVKPPKVIKLPQNDRRFLIVINTHNIMRTAGIADFLQYSGSVEITRAVKKMLLN
jgi:hypothetical protein